MDSMASKVRLALKRKREGALRQEFLLEKRGSKDLGLK